MPRAKTYRCVRGFAYPADDSVRRRIKGGDHMPQEERGELARYAIDDTVRERDLPPEVFAACVRRGAIEPVGAEPKEEEASDDA